MQASKLNQHQGINTATCMYNYQAPCLEYRVVDKITDTTKAEGSKSTPDRQGACARSTTVYLLNKAVLL